MGMSRSTVDLEPVDNTYQDELGYAETADDLSGLFRLSGGVAYNAARTANRIDGLLTKMLEHSPGCRYLADADQNLDYLMTHLRLDLIGQIAAEVASREKEAEAVAAPTTAPAGPPEPEEPVIRLDRVRPSF